MNQQIWNGQQYQDNASFVAALGTPVLALLNPQPHETILDLGCGNGTLTEQIAKVAKEVIGIDSSPSMVQATQERGLNAVIMNGETMAYEKSFNAVFTNAALHWMLDFEAVIKGVYTSLKPEGRFVGEFGGYGNIETLVKAMMAVIDKNEKMGKFINPWYFPTAEEYKSHLERNGFTVDFIKVFFRPTPLKTGVKAWLKIFANHMIANMPKELEETFLNQTEHLVKPTLYSEKDGWLADYVRLRFYAVKT